MSVVGQTLSVLRDSQHSTFALWSRDDAEKVEVADERTFAAISPKP